MRRRLLVAMVCDEQSAALLVQHPRFSVVFTAPNGTDRRAIDPAHASGDDERMAAPLLLTTDSAADLLALSERKVRQLIAEGELPAVSVGRARRIRACDLAAYVDRLGRPAGEEIR